MAKTVMLLNFDERNSLMGRCWFFFCLLKSGFLYFLFDLVTSFLERKLESIKLLDSCLSQVRKLT